MYFSFYLGCASSCGAARDSQPQGDPCQELVQRCRLQDALAECRWLPVCQGGYTLVNYADCAIHWLLPFCQGGYTLVHYAIYPSGRGRKLS